MTTVLSEPLQSLLLELPPPLRKPDVQERIERVDAALRVFSSAGSTVEAIDVGRDDIIEALDGIRQQVTASIISEDAKGRLLSHVGRLSTLLDRYERFASVRATGDDGELWSLLQVLMVSGTGEDLPLVRRLRIPADRGDLIALHETTMIRLMERKTSGLRVLRRARVESLVRYHSLLSRLEAGEATPADEQAFVEVSAALDEMDSLECKMLGHADQSASFSPEAVAVLGAAREIAEHVSKLRGEG